MSTGRRIGPNEKKKTPAKTGAGERGSDAVEHHGLRNRVARARGRRRRHLGEGLGHVAAAGLEAVVDADDEVDDGRRLRRVACPATERRNDGGVRAESAARAAGDLCPGKIKLGSKRVEKKPGRRREEVALEALDVDHHEPDLLPRRADHVVHEPCERDDGHLARRLLRRVLRVKKKRPGRGCRGAAAAVADEQAAAVAVRDAEVPRLRADAVPGASAPSSRANGKKRLGTKNSCWTTSAASGGGRPARCQAATSVTYTPRSGATSSPEAPGTTLPPLSATVSASFSANVGSGFTACASTKGRSRVARTQ